MATDDDSGLMDTKAAELRALMAVRAAASALLQCRGVSLGDEESELAWDALQHAAMFSPCPTPEAT